MFHFPRQAHAHLLHSDGDHLTFLQVRFQPIRERMSETADHQWICWRQGCFGDARCRANMVHVSQSRPDSGRATCQQADGSVRTTNPHGNTKSTNLKLEVYLAITPYTGCCPSIRLVLTSFRILVSFQISRFGPTAKAGGTAGIHPTANPRDTAKSTNVRSQIHLDKPPKTEWLPW